jgi:hypothetical protein
LVRGEKQIRVENHGIAGSSRDFFPATMNLNN